MAKIWDKVVFFPLKIQLPSSPQVKCQDGFVEHFTMYPPIDTLCFGVLLYCVSCAGGGNAALNAQRIVWAPGPLQPERGLLTLLGSSFGTRGVCGT